jgi:hypothetical protein
MWAWVPSEVLIAPGHNIFDAGEPSLIRIKAPQRNCSVTVLLCFKRIASRERRKRHQFAPADLTSDPEAHPTASCGGKAAIRFFGMHAAVQIFELCGILGDDGLREPAYRGG